MPAASGPRRVARRARRHQAERERRAELLERARLVGGGEDDGSQVSRRSRGATMAEHVSQDGLGALVDRRGDRRLDRPRKTLAGGVVAASSRASFELK